MKKQTLLALSMMGALALPVMGLAAQSPFQQSGEFFNNTAKYTMYVSGYEYTDATGSKIKYCRNIGYGWYTQIKPGMHDQITDVIDAARCGKEFNIAAVYVMAQIGSAQSPFVMCTTDNPGNKHGINYGITANQQSQGGSYVATSFSVMNGKVNATSCADDDACLSLAEKCEVSPSSMQNDN